MIMKNKRVRLVIEVINLFHKLYIYAPITVKFTDGSLEMYICINTPPNMDFLQKSLTLYVFVFGQLS